MEWDVPSLWLCSSLSSCFSQHWLLRFVIDTKCLLMVISQGPRSRVWVISTSPVQRAVSDTHNSTQLVGYIPEFQANPGSEKRESFICCQLLLGTLRNMLLSIHTNTWTHMHICMHCTYLFQWIELWQWLLAKWSHLNQAHGMGMGSQGPFYKLIMNRLWEAAADAGSRFLAFWLQGLDPAGRSSVGKNKLIRPGVWLCFESVLCSRVCLRSLQTERSCLPGLGSPVCWGCHAGRESRSRTGTG